MYLSQFYYTSQNSLFYSYNEVLRINLVIKTTGFIFDARLYDRTLSLDDLIRETLAIPSAFLNIICSLSDYFRKSTIKSVDIVTSLPHGVTPCYDGDISSLIVI